MGLTNNLGKLSNMITSTGSAVGIAQSSPSYTLDVTGTGRFTSALSAVTNLYVGSASGSGNLEQMYLLSTANQSLRINNTNNASGNINIVSLLGSNANNNTSYHFYGYTGASLASAIYGNGGAYFANSVGIGNTIPLSLLEVKGGTPFIRITDTTTNSETGLIMDANGAIRGGLTINYGTGEFKHYCGISGNSYFQTFHTNGSERMRIASDGSMGFNNSTLSSRSFSFKAITSRPIVIEAVENGGVHSLMMRPNNSGYNLISSNYLSGGTYLPLSLSARENTSDLVLTSGGNVLIATTTDNGTGAKLQVLGSAIFTDNPFPQIQCRTSSDANRQLLIGYDYANNASYIQSIQQGVAYRILYLNANGGAVYAGGVRLDTLSDVRMKDNIQPIENALDKVLSITGKKFHLKDEEEGKLRYGFIAQELEGVLDEFVIQTKMTYKDESTNEEVKDLKSIENWASSWAALLVEAIKEQQSTIEQLEARIKTLENK